MPLITVFQVTNMPEKWHTASWIIQAVLKRTSLLCWCWQQRFACYNSVSSRQTHNSLRWLSMPLAAQPQLPGNGAVHCHKAGTHSVLGEAGVRGDCVLPVLVVLRISSLLLHDSWRLGQGVQLRALRELDSEVDRLQGSCWSLPGLLPAPCTHPYH